MADDEFDDDIDWSSIVMPTPTVSPSNKRPRQDYNYTHIFPQGLLRNDPDFTILCIGEKGFGDSVCPNSDADWKRLGKLVGENTHLVTLNIGYTGTERKESYEEMLRGVGRNRSLKVLRVSSADLVVGSICRILSPFLEGNSCLVKFIFTPCQSLGMRSEMHACRRRSQEVAR